MGNAKPSGKGGRARGRGRGRGGRAAKAAERENLNREMELDTAMVEQLPTHDRSQMHVSGLSPQENEKKEVDGNAATSDKDTKKQLECPREGISFELNAESSELNETKQAPYAATASEEYPGWHLPDIGKMDPAQLASLSKGIDEDEEDYDEKDG